MIASHLCALCHTHFGHGCKCSGPDPCLLRRRHDIGVIDGVQNRGANAVWSCYFAGAVFLSAGRLCDGAYPLVAIGRRGWHRLFLIRVRPHHLDYHVHHAKAKCHAQCANGPGYRHQHRGGYRRQTAWGLAWRICGGV